MDIDTTNYTAAAKRYLEEVEGYSILPPKNGKTYEHKKQRFIVGESDSVSLNEKQANLCKLLAENPDIEYSEAFIRSGYAYESYFNEAGNVKRIKAHLTGMTNTKLTPELVKFINYLKYGAAEELLIDATWLLNEQVSLYEQCRREKQWTQAVRLLDNISTHVDVDAKVSNRLVVEGSVDYAAILQQAEARTLTHEDTKSLPAINDTEIVEGEYTEVEEVDTPVVSH